MARVIGGADGAICEGPFSVFNRVFVGSRAQALSGAVEIRGAVDPYAWIEGGEGGTRDIRDAYGNSGGAVPGYFFWRARGTFFAPANPQTGDALGQIRTGGRPSSAVNPRLTAISWIATENYAAGAEGQRCVLRSIPNGSTVARDAVEVGNSATADDVSMSVFDVSAGALRQVSRGALDSGGAGFRVLRIPNA